MTNGQKSTILKLLCEGVSTRVNSSFVDFQDRCMRASDENTIIQSLINFRNEINEELDILTQLDNDIK